MQKSSNIDISPITREQESILGIIDTQLYRGAEPASTTLISIMSNCYARDFTKVYSHQFKRVFLQRQVHSEQQVNNKTVHFNTAK